MLIAVLCFVTAASRDGVAGGMQIGYCICIYIYIYIAGAVTGAVGWLSLLCLFMVTGYQQGACIVSV